MLAQHIVRVLAAIRPFAIPDDVALKCVGHGADERLPDRIRIPRHDHAWRPAQSFGVVQQRSRFCAALDSLGPSVRYRDAADMPCLDAAHRVDLAFGQNDRLIVQGLVVQDVHVPQVFPHSPVAAEILLTNRAILAPQCFATPPVRYRQPVPAAFVGAAANPQPVRQFRVDTPNLVQPFPDFWAHHRSISPMTSRSDGRTPEPHPARRSR